MAGYLKTFMQQNAYRNETGVRRMQSLTEKLWIIILDS